MTITAADIKIGMCIEMDGKTFLVVDFQHCKPGKGPAFVRSKLKNLENGRVLENTFSSVSQKIEQVRVERRPYQFTYEDDLGAHFMHTETFEEINIDRNLINNYDLITDGQIVEVMFHTEKEAVLSAELPPIVDMEVIYTEPGIKGDTASTNSLKPATVNSATAKDGATIRVPLFINTGDKTVSTPAPVSTTSASNKRKLRLRKREDDAVLPFSFPSPLRVTRLSGCGLWDISRRSAGAVRAARRVSAPASR